MPDSAEGRLEIADDRAALARRVADWLATTVTAGGRHVRIALAGGSTPKPVYQLLASDDYRARIDWPRLEIFFGDERFVPHDHPDSNFRMARETLLDHVPLAPGQVHPMPTEGALEACARDYEATLKRSYGRNALEPDAPLFDVVLLGVGTDGHTASLLPGQPVLAETARWVAGVPHGAPQPRLTLTYPAIASSRHVAFLAAGAEKAAPVAAARTGDRRLPAARVTSQGDIIWFLDRAAAGQT